MLVKELIAKLQTFDSDALVTIASPEFGFNELTEVESVDIVLNKMALVGSTHHRANWVERANGVNVVAICIGPIDPGKV